MPSCCLWRHHQSQLCFGTIRIQIADGIVMNITCGGPRNSHHLNPFSEYARCDSCTSPHFGGEADILSDLTCRLKNWHKRLCSLRTIGHSPRSPESARTPQCGGRLAQKSELRAQQMLEDCGVPGSLRKKSELSSHQMSVLWSCGVPGSLRTKHPRRALMRWLS